MPSLNPYEYEVDDLGRLTWDGYFTGMCVWTSQRSPSPKLKVGSVIVKDNRVIATGYNGFFSGAEHKSISVDGHEVNTVHAEQNAIADAAKRGICIDKSTIYITHFPCLNCTKMIRASGINTIKYLWDYNNGNNEIAKNLLSEGHIEIKQMKS